MLVGINAASGSTLHAITLRPCGTTEPKTMTACGQPHLAKDFLSGMKGRGSELRQQHLGQAQHDGAQALHESGPAVRVS